MYKKEHWLAAAVTFCIVLACYLRTMAPTLTFWDAGEFIAASYTLGVPHPPGTPLFVIIGRVISCLPLAVPVALRLNFLSVLFGALTAFFAYLIAAFILEKRFGNDRSASGRIVVHGGAVSAALIVAGLRTVWSNCTEFEVYAAATATIFLCAWLMIQLGSSTDLKKISRVLLLVIYLISLSIANHLIVLLTAPGVAVYVLLHDRARWRYWASVLGLFIGVYLLVLKGLDISDIAERLSAAGAGSAGTAGAILRQFAAGAGILFGISRYIESGTMLFLGALITAACAVWARRQRSLPFFGAALGLFLLGFSIHLYLLIRSGLNPSINEGNPNTLATLWYVIGREQYGSNYGFLPRLVWKLATGKAALATADDLWQNLAYYFKYNMPFYTRYFGWQFGGISLTLGFTLLGLLGALTHYRSDRKSFFFWLTVFLITGPILNTYMNFRFGNGQFPEVALHSSIPAGENLHEVRDRDYFFIVSFAFFGLWSGLGLAAVVARLKALFRMDSGMPRLSQPLFAALGLLLFLAALIPLYSNYAEVDRSGNYIPPTYARNLMNSLEPDALLFTNGDNDTFPLWYIQEVEHVRQDCRVVNLSLLNVPWYMKQMRDQEPKVPIDLSDEQLDSIRGVIYDKEVKFKFDSLEITYPKGTRFLPQDQLVLHILRANNWRKPVYFTTSVSMSNRAGLTPYFIMQAAVYKVLPFKAAQLAGRDSNFVQLPEEGIVVDLESTRRLLYQVYSYDSFDHRGASGESENLSMRTYFTNAFVALAYGYEQRHRLDESIDNYLRGRTFLTNPHEWDHLIANLYAKNRQYDKSEALMDTLAPFLAPRTRMQLFQMQAQEAANNRDNKAAAHFLELALAANPTSKDPYTNLFRLYDYLGNREAAAGTIERYLARFPEDAKVRDELGNYRQTGRFDLQKAFGING